MLGDKKKLPPRSKMLLKKEVKMQSPAQEKETRGLNKWIVKNQATGQSNKSK